MFMDLSFNYYFSLFFGLHIFLTKLKYKDRQDILYKCDNMISEINETIKNINATRNFINKHKYLYIFTKNLMI